MYISSWQQYTPLTGTQEALGNLLKKLGIQSADIPFAGQGTFRRVGDYVEISVTYNTNVVPPALTPKLLLPQGFTIDTSRMDPNSTWYQWSMNFVQGTTIHGRIPIL